jgi:hypothetical protein
MPTQIDEVKPKTATRRKRPVLMSGKFYAAPVTVGKKFVTIKLPKKVAEYFELDKPEIYWAPVNGVIQLSGGQPHMVIPMMSVDTTKFIPQES